MREILFRGKRLDNGEWVNGSLLVYPDGNSCFCYICSSDDHPFYMEKYQVDPATVGQYTGLTDKNGKKIFEGDIVKYGDTVHLAVFEQRNGTAYFGMVYSPQETLPFGHYQDLRQIEVIGNSWDNPKVLEEMAT